MGSGFDGRLVKARRESGIPFRKGGPRGSKTGLGTRGPIRGVSEERIVEATRNWVGSAEGTWAWDRNADVHYKS